MAERKTITVKLSGSIFSSSEFGRISDVIQRITETENGLYLMLIAGGGATARKYIEAGRTLGLDQASLDELGIAASRMNARLLIAALGTISAERIPKNLSEIIEECELLRSSPKKKIVVCGGFDPGQSTNAVGAIISEATRTVQFINATDVDGVYDKDPKRFSDARKLATVSPEQLSQILGSESVQAGMYDLMDPVALKLISRSKIPTRIIKCDAQSLRRCILGEEEIGTKIMF
jgi:uridylate kinase